MKNKVVHCCVLLFGGNANNGANAGFVYANTNWTATNANANVGSQLILYKTTFHAMKTLPQKRCVVHRMS